MHLPLSNTPTCQLRSANPPPPNSIRLTTTLTPPTTIEGTLFTACPLTNLLALSPTSPSTTTHILPLSSIHSFTLLAPPPTHQHQHQPLAPLPTNALLTRAQNAVTKLQQEAKKRNKNVSKEAQEIFDALSRTMPARWEGKDIVVLDAVVVGAPYRGEDCKGVGGAQAGMVGRVRKVVSAFSFSQKTPGF